MKLTASLSAALTAAACGAPAPPVPDGGCTFPAQPLLTVQSDAGALWIAARSCPTQPPTRGLDQFEYLVTDASGAPQDGLALTVATFMPEMGHGASLVPTVTAEGDGRYLVGNVYLFMPGEWQLLTTIEGPEDDSAICTFQVQ
ncbi:MAG: FixH family protein [Myxococcales bacterium]